MNKEEDRWRMEEEFCSKDRKVFRKERKRASAKDRSKFKKSDQDQSKKRSLASVQVEDEHLTRGRVLAISPEGIVVSCGEKQLLCNLKGALKQAKTRMKNLVAVGDFVRLEERGQGEASIVKIDERRSVLSRADNLSRNKEQLIAVNIDQVLITASVIFPRLKPFLIDRYIIAARKGNMEPVIIINKIDLFQSPPDGFDPAILEEEKAIYEECLAAYRSLHIQLVPISSKTGEGIEALKGVMAGKTSVFSGQSGVGKSSLVNHLTGSNLAIGDVVQRTCKGSQTTTTTHLVPLSQGGFCVDTPGIKSFGLWDLQPEDLAAYYPEIVELSSACKYPDCAHTHEPECAVKKALEEGRISPLRFASYCALLISLSEKHLQR